jgi:hypothetical protein
MTLARSRHRQGREADRPAPNELRSLHAEGAFPQTLMANILTWTSWQAFACWAFVGPRHETR